jgi:CheY-like chemotaxis protein
MMGRILVIDDEALALHAIARILADEGYDVREAQDGAMGLRLWRDEAADLVLTDIAMPDLTGFELIARLRAEGATVPIIAISGSLVVGDFELVRHIKALGAVHLLAKPFSRDQLMEVIALALRSEL